MGTNATTNTTKKEEEEIILDASAVSPVGTTSGDGNHKNEPPIPAGHARFYCEKCHTVSMFVCVSLSVLIQPRPVSVYLTLGLSISVVTWQ